MVKLYKIAMPIVCIGWIVTEVTVLIVNGDYASEGDTALEAEIDIVSGHHKADEYIFAVNATLAAIVTGLICAVLYWFGKSKRMAKTHSLTFEQKMPKWCDLRQLPILIVCLTQLIGQIVIILRIFGWIAFLDTAIYTVTMLVFTKVIYSNANTLTKTSLS